MYAVDLAIATTAEPIADLKGKKLPLIEVPMMTMLKVERLDQDNTLGIYELIPDRGAER